MADVDFKGLIEQVGAVLDASGWTPAIVAQYWLDHPAELYDALYDMAHPERATRPDREGLQ
jgi:hypothetical protein